ncbi:hypothetical protein EMN47_00745 [Prolixibacteraceae bacterium JC049]|nr:hypothetical protein [Prolixibacteraceae bacterium JC049]
MEDDDFLDEDEGVEATTGSKVAPSTKISCSLRDSSSSSFSVFKRDERLDRTVLATADLSSA